MLDHLSDGRRSVAIPVGRFRDHHAVSDWVVLVSTNEGQSWSESDDPTIPANWPGKTPREKYHRFTTYYITPADGVTHSAATRWEA